MTRTTVSATRPDKTGAGEWIDIHSRTGRLMSTLMTDGQPFSIDVTPDGMTTVTPLTSPKDAAQADGDNAKTGTSPDGARITSRKTLYERFKTKLKANLDERKQ